MGVRRQVLRWCAVAGVVVAACALSACGSNSSSGGSGGTGQSAKAGGFPGSDNAVFDGLKGTIVWYNTSGGAFDTLMKTAVFQPFQQRTGVPVNLDFHADMTQFWAGEQAGKVPWSILMFDGSAGAAKSYNDKLLAPIDSSRVPLDQQQGDFDKQYFMLFGRYAMAVTWNTKKWPESGNHPTSMADFYDTTKFPGKRCLYKSPQAGGTLESAALAGGVPREKLYPLNTDIAFRELDKIKKDIVWFTSGADSVRFLVDGECDMAVTWTPQTYLAVHNNQAPLAVAWKDAIYASQYLSIPKGAPNPQAAEALMAMMILNRGAMRNFAIQNGMVMDLKKPISLPESTLAFTPVGDNLKEAVQEDGQYYATHLKEVTDAFNAWLVK